MTVQVLYFAGLREALGVAEERLELPPGVVTAGALADHLASRHAAYRERRDHVRIAVNEAFVVDAHALHDGDVVALIPPVAGG
jgi:molybdopterin synthase sulfur carrier subunit